MPMTTFSFDLRLNLLLTAFQAASVWFVRTHWDSLQAVLNLVVAHDLVMHDDVILTVQVLEKVANLF